MLCRHSVLQRGWKVDEAAGLLVFVDGEKNPNGVVDIPSDEVCPRLSATYTHLCRVPVSQMLDRVRYACSNQFAI